MPTGSRRLRTSRRMATLPPELNYSAFLSRDRAFAASVGVPRLAFIDILFICTGNICRSPMAEALLRHRLAAAGVEARVQSAGLFLPGLPAYADSAAAMVGLGHDIAAHRSRRLSAAMIRAADLAVGLAREHVREAVLLAPDAWPRCYTLKELVRRAETAGARTPAQTFEAWTAGIHAGRRREDLLGASAADDVADPYGLGLGTSERTATELDGLVSRLVELGWGWASRGDAA
ncbi:MAG: hypothetical protein ACRD1K_18670 [Acidimicrobiales bacterium]